VNFFVNLVIFAEKSVAALHYSASCRITRLVVDSHSCIAVVPKLVRAVTQIKIWITSYYPQKIFSHFRLKISFAVITHTTEQQCG